MQMRIVGNVWLSGRAYGCGEVLDLPEPDAERLAVLGVAEPVPAVPPRHDPEPVEVQETVEPADSQPVEMPETVEPADSQPMPEPVEVHETAESADSKPVPEPSKPKRKRGKR